MIGMGRELRLVGIGLLGTGAGLLAASGCSSSSKPASTAAPVELDYGVDALAAGTSGEIVDADLTSDRRLLLVDARNHQVVTVTPAGRVVERCGRYGAGPGEMIGPIDVETGPDGAVAVLDMSLRRLAVWDRGCRFRGALVFKGEPLWIGWSSDGPLVAKTVQRLSEVSVVSIDPRKLAVADTLAVVEAPPFDQPGQVTCRLCAIARSDRGTVAVAAPDTAYAIHVIRGRSVVRGRWGRTDLPAVPVGAAERRRLQLRRDSALARIRADGKRSPRLSPLPRYQWRVMHRGLRFDDRGDLWVQTYAEGPGRGSVDVFRASGGLRRHLTLGSFGDLASVRGDRIVALGRDAEGGVVISVLRVPR